MNSNKLLLNGILAFSILSLSIAYFIQYVLGHKPCNLCIIERIPYIAGIILISLIFILNKYQRIISVLILLFFVFGTLVSYFTYLFGKKFGDFIEKKGALWFTLTGIFIVILAAVLYIAFVK